MAGEARLGQLLLDQERVLVLGQSRLDGAGPFVAGREHCCLDKTDWFGLDHLLLGEITTAGMKWTVYC